MKRKGLVITAVIILIAVIFGGIAFKAKGNKGKEVTLHKIQKGELNSYLATSGTVKSKNVKEYFGSGLKINKVNVKVGDAVKKGDALITYDTSDLNVQLKQAEIQHNNAVLQKQDIVNQKNNLEGKVAELNKLIKQLENSTSNQTNNSTAQLEDIIKELQNNPQLQTNIEDLNKVIGTLQNNANPQNNVEQLKATRDQLKAQIPSSEKLKQLDNSVALAKTSLEAVQSNFNAVKDGIVADFDGVITSLSGTTGAMSTPNMAVITLQDLNSLKLTISLNKFDTEKVKVGQNAEIKNNNKAYSGQVAFISPSASKQGNAAMAAVGGSSEGNLSADIDVLEPAPELKVDFQADVNILTGTVAEALKVPIEALVTEKDGKNFVFVVEGGLAKKKEVRVGLQSDTEMQIVEGLGENEAIILNTTDLKDGDKVIESQKEE